LKKGSATRGRRREWSHDTEKVLQGSSNAEMENEGIKIVRKKNVPIEFQIFRTRGLEYGDLLLLLPIEQTTILCDSKF
jgi:hypothetical protein